MGPPDNALARKCETNLTRISHRAGPVSKGGESKCLIAGGIGLWRQPGGGKTVCGAAKWAFRGLGDMFWLLRQAGYGGARQALHPRQSRLEFAVLFGGGLIERGGLRAGLDGDRLAVELVGPLEVGAVTLGRVAVAGAPRLAALHHPLQDGPLQKEVQLAEFLPDLAEALGRGAGKGRAGCFARGHDLYGLYEFCFLLSYYRSRLETIKHFCRKTLPSRAPLRLNRHGTRDHPAGKAETVQPPRSATGSPTEIGRTGSGLALRWGRHHLRWGSVGIEEAGGANRHRAAFRRLLHRLPQPPADRAPAVGSRRAARVRLGAGLRGSQRPR